VTEADAQSKELLRCLSDLRWTFKSLGVQLVARLGEDVARLGDLLGPTWQFMSDDHSIGYTDGHVVELANGTSIISEVSLFWVDEGIRISGSISAVTSEEGGEYVVKGLVRMDAADLESVIRELRSVRQALDVSAEEVVDFMVEEDLL
jgi:hypothetical protein